MIFMCITITNMVWFQRIDLRDNSLKVAGLMALALSMKVNTSVTQLDLDDIPKKKMVSISVIHLGSQCRTARPDYGLHNPLYTIGFLLASGPSYMSQWTRSLQAILSSHSLFFSVCCQPCNLLLMSSITCLIHLVLHCSINVYPVNFNCSPLLIVLVVSITFYMAIP